MCVFVKILTNYAAPGMYVCLLLVNVLSFLWRRYMFRVSGALEILSAASLFLLMPSRLVGPNYLNQDRFFQRWIFCVMQFSTKHDFLSVSAISRSCGLTLYHTTLLLFYVTLLVIVRKNYHYCWITKHKYVLHNPATYLVATVELGCGDMQNLTYRG